MAGILMTFKYTLTCDDLDTLKEAVSTLDTLQGCVEASMKDGYGVDVKLSKEERRR